MTNVAKGDSVAMAPLSLSCAHPLQVHVHSPFTYEEDWLLQIGLAERNADVKISRISCIVVHASGNHSRAVVASDGTSIFATDP